MAKEEPFTISQIFVILTTDNMSIVNHPHYKIHLPVDAFNGYALILDALVPMFIQLTLLVLYI